MHYDAVIFDSDGVLVTLTEREPRLAAVRSAFAAAGVEDPDREHVEAMEIGVTPEILRDVAGAYDLDPAAFWEHRDGHLAAFQREEIREGRKTLYDDVDHVLGIDRPKGVVSSNQHATVEFVLDHHGLTSEFGTYYGRQPTIADIERKKPDPHFLERALSDLDASDALFVGDSWVDVEAAERAGVDSAFVRRPHRADYDLDAEPTYEVADLTEIPSIVE